MSNKPQKHHTFLDFLGIGIYFAVYKISNPEIAVRNAALALIVVTILTFIWFYAIKKQPMPRMMLVVNLLTIFFALPSAYFNSLDFIKIKIVLIKLLMFIIPTIMALFGKNMIKLIFAKSLDYHVDDKQWNIINSSFILTALFGMLASLVAAFTLNDNDYINFKTFFIPVISSLYIIPFFYYLLKAGFKAEVHKKSSLEKMHPENNQAIDLHKANNQTKNSSGHKTNNSYQTDDFIYVEKK